VAAFKTKNAATFVMISSPELKSGSKYTLYKGGTYSGTLDADNYGKGGTVSGAISLGSVTVSGKVNVIS
jgi:hypothetical protein